MRISVILVAALALAACGDKKVDPATTGGDASASGPAIPPPAGKSWTEVTALTADGGFRMGNPDAKVKLVEFASLTCPHCKDFHAAASETIKNKYVASGEVSYEFRNFVLNGPDYAASLLARCQGPEAFFGLLGAFFTEQANWMEPFIKLTPADQKAISAVPQDQQMAAIATIGQLDSFVRARGIPKAKFDQCLADPAATKALADLRTQATERYKLTGTPGFVINDVTQEAVYDWATLEPKLQAALQ